MSELLTFQMSELVIDRAVSSDTHRVLQETKEKLAGDQSISGGKITELKYLIRTVQQEVNAHVDRIAWEYLHPEIPLNFPYKQDYKEVDSFAANTSFLFAVGPDILVSHIRTSSAQNERNGHPKYQIHSISDASHQMQGKILLAQDLWQVAPNSFCTDTPDPNTKTIHQHTYQAASNTWERRSSPPNIPQETIAVLPSGEMFCLDEKYDLHLYTPTPTSWEKAGIFRLETNDREGDIARVSQLLSRLQNLKYFPGRGLFYHHGNSPSSSSDLDEQDYFLEPRTDETFRITPLENSDSFSPKATLLSDGRMLNYTEDDIRLRSTSLQRNPSLQTELLYQFSSVQRGAMNSSSFLAEPLGPNRFLIKLPGEILIREKIDGVWTTVEEFGLHWENGLAQQITKYVVFPDGKISVQYRGLNRGSPIITTKIFDGTAR